MRDANDMIPRVFVHRHTRETAVQKVCEDLADPGVSGQTIDAAPWGHDLAGHMVTQGKDTLDNLLFVQFHGAFLDAFPHQGEDVFLGDAGDILGTLPKKSQNALGRPRQQADDRATELCQQFHGARNVCGNGLRVELRQAFWHELANHQGQVGNQDHHQDQGHTVGKRADEGQGGQERHQVGGNVGRRQRRPTGCQLR